MRRLFRSTALATVVIASASCTDGGVATGAMRSGRIALSASFSPAAIAAYEALAQFGLDVTNVHLRLTAPDGSTRDSTIAFPATMEVLQIDVDVPIRTAGERFTADVELRNANAIVLFSGRQVVIAQAAGIPGTAPSPMLIDYTGPGRDVKAITIGPGGSTMIGASTRPFAATAVDAAGAPVPNFLVAWSISDTILARVAESGNTGAVATSAGKRGVVTLSATTPLGITGSTQVALVPVPARVVVVSGSGQSGAAGHVVANPLIVEVQASDNLPVPGAPVTFGTITAGGAVGTASATADATGRASTTLAVGPATGTYQFEARAGSTTPAGATAIATPAPAAAIAALSGSGQTASAGDTLPQPLVVRVTNEFGGVVEGATVNWTRVVGSGALGALTTTTGSDGTARVIYAFGTTAGTEIVRASLPSIAGSATDFTVSATAGRAASIVSTGSGQHAPVGTALPSPFAAQLLDAFGNPVHGVVVGWRVTSNSGTTATFAPQSATSDLSGFATTVVTLGGTPGPLTVVAQVNNLTATYQVTGDIPPSAAPGAIAGVVRSAADSTPIAAKVELKAGIGTSTGPSLQVVQTSSGQYSFANQPAGAYSVIARAAGYADVMRTVVVVGGTTTGGQDIFLPPLGAAGGQSNVMVDFARQHPKAKRPAHP